MFFWSETMTDQESKRCHCDDEDGGAEENLVGGMPELETTESLRTPDCISNTKIDTPETSEEGLEETTAGNDEPSEDGDEEDSDPMLALLSAPPEFQATLRIGIAALSYGAVSYKIETFMVRLLKRFGYSCSAWVINKYLFLSIYQYNEPRRGNSIPTGFSSQFHLEEEGRRQRPEPSTLRLPYTVSVPIKEGADLQKLEDLSCICADLLHNAIDLREAHHQLQELEERGQHWDPYTRGIAYAVCSALFAALLKGGWTDIWLSLFGGAFCLLATTAFKLFWPQTRNTFGLFLAALLPAALATSVSLIPGFGVDVNTVVASSIVAEVPGFGITRGMSELGKNRILVGLGHWIGAFLTCVWLAFGAAIGTHGVLFVTGRGIEDTQGEEKNHPIDPWWYVLVAPVLGFCFSVYWSVGRPQLFMSVVVCCIAFGMSLTIPGFSDPNLGNVVAAFVTTLAAQVWSRSWHHKLLYGPDHVVVPSPSTIVMLPAFFVLVGGSIGVRAFAFIVVGDMDDGRNTLLQFLLVPATLILGMYLAQSILPSTSVL